MAKAEKVLSSEDTVYLSGAKFQLYKGDKLLGTYTTDENGKITIAGLYQYIDGKDEEAEYLLKETMSPEGYSKVKDITFKVDGSTGELKLVNINGDNKPYTIDGNKVKLVMEDSPSFRLIKKDSETQETLANVKFAIYNIDKDTKPAVNSKGETIGTKETINGKEYYTVTTNENGEITADLPEGIYKAIEIQAADKYDLTNSTYYFGIGTSRAGKMALKATWAQGIGGSSEDEINSVAPTSDGGYIAGGYFHSGSIELANGDKLINSGGKGQYGLLNANSMIIKYGADNEIEWSKTISSTYANYIYAVTECNDGGIVAGGMFYKSIDLGNNIKLESSSDSYNDGMIVKYSASGECEWAKKTGSDNGIFAVTKCNDGEIIAGGNGILTKYNNSGECEWTKTIGNRSYERIGSVTETSDGEIIAVGKFESSSIDLGNGVSLSNTGESDGMIIKYNAEGECEWAKAIGGSRDDQITLVAETSDGGIIAGGYFRSDSVDLENGLSLSNKGDQDVMIIKYSSSGECEWAKGIGGTSSDYIEAVAETSDGGIIVGGYFGSDSIDLGNGAILNNTGSSDGMIIKYENKEIPNPVSIKGFQLKDDGRNKEIVSIAETKDGGMLVGGYFHSDSIDLGNGVSLSNKGSRDGMIIKYNAEGKCE